jgi:hypothetical protein
MTDVTRHHVFQDREYWRTTVTASVDLEDIELDDLITELAEIKQRITDTISPAEDGVEPGPWTSVETDKGHDFTYHRLEVTWIRPTTPQDIERAEREQQRVTSMRRAQLEAELRRLDRKGR